MPLVLGLLAALLAVPTYVGASAAAPAATGTLSGTAVGPGGEGAEGILVTAYRSTGPGEHDWEDAGSVDADASGGFSFDVPVGSYRILFTDDWRGRYLNVHHGGADEFDYAGATRIEIREGETTNVVTHLRAAAKVAGSVVSQDGGGIGNVEVSAMQLVDGPDGPTWRVQQNGYADGTGRYQVNNLEAGTYRLRFSKMGYVTEFHDGPDGEGADEIVDAADVSLDAGEALEIDAILDRGSSIAGNVVVPVYAPEPNAFVNVLAERHGRWEPVASSLVGWEGRYVVSGLRAGTYKVVFGDFDGRYPTTYHPGVTDLADAETIVVPDRDTHVDDIDFTFAGPAPGAVQGRVTNAWCNPVRVPVTAYTWDADLDAWTVSAETFSAADGYYELADLRPGEHVVEFSRDRAARFEIDKHVWEYSGGVLTIDEASPVTVEAGQTLTGQDAQLDIGGRAHGHAVSEDGWALPFVTVRLHRRVVTDDGVRWQVRERVWVPTNPEGRFEAGQLPEGTYRLEFVPTDGNGGELAPPVFYPDATRIEDAADVPIEHGALTSGIDVVLDSGGWQPPNEDWARPEVAETFTGPTQIAPPQEDSCDEEEEPSPSPEPSPTPTPTPSQSPTPTPTQAPTPTPTPSAGPAPAVSFAGTPRLKGRVKVGRRIRVVHGAVSPSSATVRYVWSAGGKRIWGVTGRGLRVTHALLGKRISVRVVARAPGWTRTVVVLRATAQIRDPR